MKTKALVFNLGSVVAWSLSPVMISYTSSAFSVLSATVTRYAVSLLILWPWYFVVVPNESRARIRHELPRLVPRLAGIAVLNLAFQLCYTASLYRIFPGLALIVYQLGMLFGIGLSALLFADERPTLRRPLFHVALVASLVGVAIVIRGRFQEGGDTTSLGIVLMVSAALFWMLLSAAVKRWIPPDCMPVSTPIVLTLVTAMLALVHVLAPSGPFFPSAPAGLWAWLVVSGLVGIGLGHSLYYRSVPVLGLASASVLQLLRPLIGSVASVAFLGERFTPIQILGGVLLLSGAYVVTRLRFSDIPGS